MNRQTIHLYLISIVTLKSIPFSLSFSLFLQLTLCRLRPSSGHVRRMSFGVGSRRRAAKALDIGLPVLESLRRVSFRQAPCLLFSPQAVLYFEPAS
ncbi:hypothetical protein BJ508DRAFT_36584 [Ascobolus immersus RN42]|uniref:Uncharacterized protein n=1 Tax=Ascobolus immersus RN42 TaxID=1160509 RepID=A0A3N4IJG5_ASCIM|nr:hypothetical protein BJ508DRAFT_36584 [Ascobolus immersus RN42]